MVFRVDGVVNKSDFISAMQTMSNEVRAEPSIDGEEVMMPGDPEIKTSKIRIREGIPLDDITLDSFIKLSKEYDVPLHLL